MTFDLMRAPLRWLCAAMALAVPSLATAAEPAAPSGNQANPMILYAIELQSDGVDARLLLNGVEILRGRADQGKIVQSKVNSWMLGQGEANQLVLYASLPEQPVASPPPPRLKVTIFRGPWGQEPSEVASFTADPAKLPKGVGQVVWRTSFASEPSDRGWAWERAEIVHDANSAPVLEVIHAMTAALEAHANSELLDLFRVLIDENSQAYGIKPERIEKQLNDWCDSWATTGPHQVPNLVDLSLAVEGEGRLLRIERADGTPLFGSVNVGEHHYGPERIYIAKIDGRWVIVR